MKRIKYFAFDDELNLYAVCEDKSIYMQTFGSDISGALTVIHWQKATNKITYGKILKELLWKKKLEIL